VIIHDGVPKGAPVAGLRVRGEEPLDPGLDLSLDRRVVYLVEFEARASKSQLRVTLGARTCTRSGAEIGSARCLC
jgi:hypothetical protein